MHAALVAPVANEAEAQARTSERATVADAAARSRLLSDDELFSWATWFLSDYAAERWLDLRLAAFSSSTRS